ncbi:MAG TPA: hypothetical protein VMW48_19405 [Vicinamibacterales bacterium]|nr:hypothetical protein [Vicinamibacterales bacterium]
MDKTSCVTLEPLSKLDENGSASILNYNLPQSTAYDVVSYIRIDIPEKLFKDAERKAPAQHYWKRFDLEKDKNTPQRIGSVLKAEAYSGLDEIMNTGLNFTTEEVATSSGVKFKAANLTVSTQTASFATEYAANKIAAGYRPQLVRRATGKQALVFQRRPKKAQPAIYLVMRMKMASYLGNYGAGLTLSTFSLLPGEKTTIQVRDYRHDETTKATSQSVLDSYSESAMEDLQTTVEMSTASSVETSETDTDSMAAHAGGEVGVNLGIVKIGGDAGAEASSVNTTTEAVSQQVNTLNNAVDHHVQTADTQRQIEIKTDVTETSISETETTTTRQLENINRSRVLNFVFRQLLQEYYTITYLDNVTLVYSNGYDTTRKTGTLSSLDNLLRAVLVDEKTVAKVRNDIYVHLCNIPDYTGTRTSFIEQVVEKHANCIDPKAEDKPVSYVRKRRGLEQQYQERTVDGIILDVTHRILRTPSVIVDALLGQGAALDCYNQELQDAAVVAAQLANRKTEQAVALIDGITDPEEKARLYNHVFGTCCPTAQDAPAAETE